MIKTNPTTRPDVKHVLDTLKSAIRLLGFSVRDIEKKLGYSFGYLSWVFAGTIELKVEHVMDIVDALDMMPEELLALSIRRCGIRPASRRSSCGGGSEARRPPARSCSQGGPPRPSSWRTR